MLVDHLFTGYRPVRESVLSQSTQIPTIPRVPGLPSADLSAVSAPATVATASVPPAVNTPALEQKKISDQADGVVLRSIVQQLQQQLKLVRTADDLAQIKKHIDRAFARHGLVSESAFEIRDRLIESVNRKRV